jgi:hypothetical protein
MEKLIRNQNIEQFRRLLGNNPGDVEREVLESLLAEEEAKANMQERVERGIVSPPNTVATALGAPCPLDE